MRISIRHRERTRGFWRAVHQVEVTTAVRFTEVEKAVIRMRQLEDFIVLKRQPDWLSAKRLALLGTALPDWGYDLLVRDLACGRRDHFFCETPAHANVYECALVDGLRSLKKFIEIN